MPDLSKYNSPELRQLQVDIDKELKTRRKDDAKKAHQEMKEVAAKYGLALEDIVGTPTGTRARAPAKYRHPQNPRKTWNGRGRKPHWVREWEDSGKSLEDLRIG